MAELLCKNTKMSFEAVSRVLATLRESDKINKLKNLNLQVHRTDNLQFRSTVLHVAAHESS